MLNALRLFFRGIYVTPIFIYAYFSWILKYYKHKDKYPLEERYKKTRDLLIRVIKILNLDVKSENLDVIKNHKGKYLLVSNHRSSLDPIYYIALSEKPISFIAKLETKKVPFLGKVIYDIDGYFLDRKDIKSQIKTFKEIVKNMNEKNLPYYIFPEGTRNKEPKTVLTLPYKDGSLKLAYWAQCDVINAVSTGSEGAFKSLKKNYKKRNLLFHYFPVYKYEDFKDLKTTDFMPKIQTQTNELLPLLTIENDKRNQKKTK